MRRRQRGAALLLAMLTVALVASLSASAYWQQWRGHQFELTARQRSQAQWLLTGALDWSRLILREDARASSVDHLAEPWAVPLQETRLSNFLSGGRDGDVMVEALLSGRISDEQGKLNLRNLVELTGERARINAAEHQAFVKLFNALGIPGSELLKLELGLLDAWGNGADAALKPQRYEQLAALGLSRDALRRLAPHATWLPAATRLNVNTASAIALHASLPELELARAQAIVAQRERKHFSAVSDLRPLAPEVGDQLDNSQRHSVGSNYFVIRGLLRLDGATLVEESLVVREGTKVSVLWRAHGGLARPQAPIQ